MSRRLNRLWLLPALFLASDIWALGLGDIRLSSALNEPLRAEIELLSATPDELTNITVQLASAETFARYGIDRPLYLTRLQFEVSKSGRSDGNIIRIRSVDPIREPFLTFLVEASWSRGRLLREYTVLLDPPTFAPPPVAQSTQTVTAPSRAEPRDSGRIERPAPEPAAQPEREAAPPLPTAPRTSSPSAAEPTDARREFAVSPGGEIVVQRGDTLWGIAQRVRPDNRLTMNQVMLAIFEANPEAFAGNINLLSAGASLRIPSADDIFRISRADAQSEASRQNDMWSSGTAGVARTQPSLTLVPPDDEQTDYDDTSRSAADDVDTAEDDELPSADPIEARIRDIESMLADQDSLIEISDNELAALRAELARLRGEEPAALDSVETDEVDATDEPPVDETADDEVFAADSDDVVDEEADVAADTEADTVQPEVPRVVRRLADEPGLLDRILDAVTGIWGAIGGALIIVLAILIWFARRAAGRSEEDSTGVWNALDADDLDSESVASTERLRALAREDDTAIVVVEQGRERNRDDIRIAADDDLDDDFGDGGAADGASMEDTFSSETAINLDQTDPVAEADFHMAYGLYDQAADLINGALSLEPERKDLLAKLCEIYYVWGNRDAFVDAAVRMKAVAGSDDADWGKVVIMGQQIAGEHEMFSGVSAGAATRAIDLSFEGGMDEAGELDMDFASGPDGMISDVIDLGADSGEQRAGSSTGIDFSFDDEDDDISASVTRDMPRSRDADKTAESPTIEMAKSGHTAESPTIEQQFATQATGELPSLPDNEATKLASLDDDETSTGSTAEINLDDLDLDLDLAGLGDGDMSDDLDDVIDISDFDDTSESRTLRIDDDLDATGKNYAIDDNTAETGRNREVSDTGRHAAADNKDDTDVGIEIDPSLLDATGMTQVLNDDMTVETANDIDVSMTDDDRTMLAPGLSDDDTVESGWDDGDTLQAPMDDDESTQLGAEDDDFAFAKTEALPKNVFTGNSLLDETGELPGLPAGSTDLDLDLDDLTAALKVSGISDTVDQQRDDKTVEQLRVKRGARRDLDDEDSSPTEALSPEDISDDLHDARTMTEVGTKLDLARAYVDMGDPAGARSILEEVLDEGDVAQRQQAQKLLDSLPS
jgi:pilus assembly protein FimV